MAQNISLLNAQYTDVPSVTLPKTGGGTASFVDVTSTTAVASDVASGKLFFTALGVLTQGTASGGGTTGLVYESGTYTPTSDSAQPTISFANTHSTTPFFVCMSDTSAASGITSNSNTSFVFFDMYRLTGSGYPYSTSATRYAIAYYGYRSSNGHTVSSVQIQYNSDNTGTSSTSYSRYWVTASNFHPYSNSSSRYWRKNRNYKWIAVWKPTS